MGRWGADHLSTCGQRGGGGGKAEASGGVSSVINHAEGTSTGHSVKWDRKVRRAGGLGWGWWSREDMEGRGE